MSILGIHHLTEHKALYTIQYPLYCILTAQQHYAVYTIHYTVRCNEYTVYTIQRAGYSRVPQPLQSRVVQLNLEPSSLTVTVQCR